MIGSLFGKLQEKTAANHAVWLLTAVSIGLTLVAFVVSLNHALATGDLSNLLTHIVFLGPVGIAFIILGVLVASRQPKNAIGWIFLIEGLLYTLTLAFGVYDDLGSFFPTGGSLPGAALAKWVSSWIWVPSIILPTTFLFLLFPNGRLPSHRWRPVFWAAVLGLILSSLGEALPHDSANGSAVELISTVGYLLVLFVGLGGGVVAFGVRFRSSKGAEREQMKWLAYALVMMLLFLVFGLVISFSIPQTPFLEDFLIVLTNVAILGIAVGASVAILRYRLYDIDLIINRTLVFATLTGSIALLYVLIVGATGYFLQTDNDMAGLLITGAIMLVVFRPLNNKLQQSVEQIIPSNRPPMNLNSTPDVVSISTEPLPSNWLTITQIAWGVLAIAAIAVILASLPGYAAKFGGQLAHATGDTQPPGAHFFAAASGVASLVSALLSIGLSAVLFRQKFKEPIAILLSFFLMIYGIVLGGPLESASWYWLGSASFATTFQAFLLATPLIALLLLFPNGRFVPGWTRWVLFLSLPWNIGLLFLVPFDAESFNRSPLLTFVVGILFIGFGIVGIYAQIYRYLRAASNNERQQIRWAIYGFALWLTYMFISSIPYYYLIGLSPDAPTPWWGPASELGWWLSLNILPICLTIAITRYQLWDIDFVINRTLVYGTLTIGVLALYAIIVGGMGLYFRAEDNIVLPLLATGLAAILFHPLRLRLQQRINRLMYGDRDDPFDVLARLGERLENTLSPEMVYPTIVETVSQTLKLPYAAVNIWQNGRWETAESYGKPVNDPAIYPLNYQGETVGQLLVARRAAGETFGQADERIIRNIARQAGAAVHAAQLVSDLQHSRHQLVTAREEERRRLRRDLHDGLGPHLASQTLTIDAIDKLLDRDPERARGLLQDLKKQSQTAVKDIRRVVYNLRPPALDELGLIGALNEDAARQSQNGLRVTVEAPEQLPPLPAAVEVAAYRVAQEAITNVVRHAQASNCSVRLGLEPSGKENRLRIEVEDDGQGLPTDYLAGVGLQSMRERAAELGGSCHIGSANGRGVRITAVFPLSTT